MGRITDITRAGMHAVHVHLQVNRTDLIGLIFGLKRDAAYLGAAPGAWYTPDGYRLMDPRQVAFLQDARAKWDNGKYPVNLWD